MQRYSSTVQSAAAAGHSKSQILDGRPRVAVLCRVEGKRLMCTCSAALFGGAGLVANELHHAAWHVSYLHPQAESGYSRGRPGTSTAMTCCMPGPYLQGLATGGAVKAAKMLLNAAWHVAHLKRLTQWGRRLGRALTAWCAGTAGRCLLGWRPCQPLQQPLQLAAVVSHAGEQLPQLCQKGPKALQAVTARAGGCCNTHCAIEGTSSCFLAPAWNGCLWSATPASSCYSCVRRGLRPSEHRQSGKG